MTTKPKQDGTMELDVGQIDLLDLPLPPPRKSDGTLEEEPRVSKGPPPLPPSLPPIETKVPATMDMPMDMEVPSLALPEPSTKSARHPVPVSARKLVDGPTEEQRSPVARFLIGIGGATLLCVGAFLLFRSLHKTPAVERVPAASAASTAPMHAFTMAPIEFTGPASSDTEPEPSATASAPPTASAATAHATGGAAHPTATAKPTSTRRPDDVIKVEN